jgi:hypothetical protein
MYYHTGLRYQRGAGFASLFSGLFKMLKPLASMGLKAGKQFIGSNFAKKAGSAMLDIGKKAAENMIVDVLEGANVKDSAVKQLDEAKTKIATAIKGGGRKRKRKSIQTNSKSKKLMEAVKYSLIDD